MNRCVATGQNLTDNKLFPAKERYSLYKQIRIFMTELFTISYTQPSDRNTAVLHKECKSSSLGEGMKDICLYLKNILHPVHNIPTQEATLHIVWQKDPSVNDYKWMSTEEMVQRIELMRNILVRSENIGQRVNMHNFIMDDITSQMDEILLSLSSGDKQATLKQYKSQIKYIFGALSSKLLPQNRLSVDFGGFIPSQVQEIMSTLYKQIPESDKKKFKYVIDFDVLTADLK